MKLSMKSLAALLMMLNGAVMASENVNTPENRQFLKQQDIPADLQFVNYR